MNGEQVLDASVLAKCVISEPDSDLARAAVAAATRLIAPDFVFVEIASIAAKKVRQGAVTRTYAAEAMDRAGPLLNELVPSGDLVAHAFVLAVKHGVSVYDGLYLALAVHRNATLLTADIRLVTRAGRAGLGARVQALTGRS